MSYQLAIFDLDGTILDTLEDLANSLNHALKNNGLPERSLAEVKSFVGNGIRSLMERGVPKGCEKELIDRVHEDFTANYRLHCADRTKPYAGITQVLDELKTKGIAVAIVSNKADYAVQELCGRYFAGLFDAAAGEKPEIRRKPSPDSVNAVLNALNVKKENAVYIGDSEVDVQTAKNADIDCISVCWGFRDADFLKQNGAQILLYTPNELTGAICGD